jgi:hypothetical protein
MRVPGEHLSGFGRELTGWLYLAAGVGVLAAAALIPAQRQLERAGALRERAEAQVEARREMLAEAGERIAALTQPDEALLASLAQTHLNLAPEGARPLALRIERAAPAARPVARLSSNHQNVQPLETSLLERLLTDSPSRSIVIVAGAVCVLIGLLPASQPKRSEVSS